MIKLAVFNVQTNIVENTIVPPQGSNLWFCPEGYDAVESDSAQIGDIYNPETGEFTKPDSGEPDNELPSEG